MMLHEEARAAIEAKQAAEKRLAGAADCPPWRHVVFALLMAALVASSAIPLPLRLGALALILIGVAVIVQSDRRRTGMFINGYRRGKTRIVTFAMLVVILPLYAYSARAGLAGDTTTALLLAIPTFVVSLVFSVVWQRVFVRELGA
jgi:hypothetical protein